jgi:hypothetical protein
MLYQDNVSKGALLTAKGFQLMREGIEKVNLAKMKPGPERDNMYAQKQVLIEILIGNSLKETLAKTKVGAQMLAIESGQDPSKVTDKDKVFKVTSESGRKGEVTLPGSWVRSLCSLYLSGFDQVPQFGAKTMDKLDDLIKKKANRLDKKTLHDDLTKLNAKDASSFLDEMKACKVTVKDKPDPVVGDVAARDTAIYSSVGLLFHEYTILPPLAGADRDPRVKAAGEYWTPPAPATDPNSPSVQGQNDPTLDQEDTTKFEPKWESGVQE